MNSLGVFTGSTELLSPLSHSVSGLTVYYTNIPLDVVHDDGYSVPNNVAAPLVNMAPRLPDSIREAIENYVPTDIMLSHAMHFFDDTTLTDMLVPVAEFASDNDEKVDTRPYLLIRNNIDTPNKATLIYFDLDSVEIHGILTQFGYVGAWYLVETKPSNSLLFEYSYNPSTNWIKNYHHYEQPDDKMRIYAESVYYTSGIPCYTVSQSGVKTSVDCSAYGAKSFPQSVLDNLDELESDPFNRVINTLLRIPAMIGKFVYDFTLGPVVDFFSSVIADNTVGNIWTSYLLIAESFFVLPGHLGDVMMALPDEIRVLFQSILVISFSLFAYKLYRVIRGLLI